MALPSVYRRRVGRDLAVAYAWYEEQRPSLGDEFLAQVNVCFDAIEQFPAMFAAVHGEVRRAFVARFPYAVFFRVEPTKIVVLTVLHTARDSKHWPKPSAKTR